MDKLLNTVKMILVQVSGKTDPLVTETFSVSFPRKEGGKNCAEVLCLATEAVGVIRRTERQVQALLTSC